MVHGYRLVLTTMWQFGTVCPDWKRGLFVPVWKKKEKGLSELQLLCYCGAQYARQDVCPSVGYQDF